MCSLNMEKKHLKVVHRMREDKQQVQFVIIMVLWELGIYMHVEKGMFYGLVRTLPRPAVLVARGFAPR